MRFHLAWSWRYIRQSYTCQQSYIDLRPFHSYFHLEPSLQDKFPFHRKYRDRYRQKRGDYRSWYRWVWVLQRCNRRWHRICQHTYSLFLLGHKEYLRA